ncbi:MAG TPA: restriction endonuclease subunit S, partial [Candidatus Competibacter sp.]|nr:restriction endonuclease subunit S [Candidatus Competibacter sp.]
LVKISIYYSMLKIMGNRMGLNFGQVRRICVPLPPEREQRAIAAALSDVDALLDGLDRLIAKKRDIKQAAMQQLLTGQTRLPGFSGEWEVKRLGDCLLSQPDYGINAPATQYSDRLPTYIRITDITEDGQFRPDPCVSVQSTYADRYLLNDGDLVFARTGASVGKSYHYRLQDGSLVFAGFLIRVRPDPNTLVSAYLAAYVSTRPYWNWVKLMSMRSGQPGINSNEYAQLLICLPPIGEQTAIAAILSDMDAEIAALEARRDKTRALKQGMMQELLTGRIRLVDPSIPKLSEGEPDASTATGH